MSWESDRQIAKGMLRDRERRRALLFRSLLLSLGLMALGLWVVDDWLGGNPWRFLCWWGACAVVTCFVFLLALYDLLAVIREERGKH